MGRVHRRSDQQVIFCYAEGRAGKWEGACPNFDLAVQGDSFDSVRYKLQEAIDLYLKSVMSLPDEADRKRLLNRQAPWSVWLRPFWHILRAALTGKDDRSRYEFTFPSPMHAVA